MSGPFVVFDVLIPRTDDRTDVVHPPSLFDDWTIETAERFGGVTQLAADILGFWFDSKDLSRTIRTGIALPCAKTTWWRCAST